jgi:hypothetical protein
MREQPELIKGKIPGHLILKKAQKNGYLFIKRNDEYRLKQALELEANGLLIAENQGDRYKISPAIKFLEDEPKRMTWKEAHGMPTLRERHWDDVIIESKTIIVAVNRGDRLDPDAGIVIVLRPAKPTFDVPDWITVTEYKAR